MSKNIFYIAFYTMLVLAQKIQASEISICFSEHTPAKLQAMAVQHQNYAQWQMYNTALYQAANEVSCRKIEDFSRAITTTITGVSIVGIIALHLVPTIHMKLLVGGSIAALQQLNLYVRDIPCHDDEEELQRQLTESICTAADGSNGAFECAGKNSSFRLKVEWQNNMSHEYICTETNGGLQL